MLNEVHFSYLQVRTKLIESILLTVRKNLEVNVSDPNLGTMS